MIDKVILGIDPGTIFLGYSVIHQKGSKIEVLTMDVFSLKQRLELKHRLKLMVEKVFELIEKYKPDEVAIEEPFYYKDAQVTLKLGKVLGVVLAAAIMKSIPTFEYSPKYIKRSITGNGNASKEQVAKMLVTMSYISGRPKYLDASDALAVAICHYNQKEVGEVKKKYKSWTGFLSENPDRIDKK